MKLQIKLIIAIDENGVMGIKNKLPWNLQDDLKQFKKETMGSPLLMGSNTFKSLPGILPGREHIVLSSVMEGNENMSVFTSLKQAIDYVSESYNKVYIIGGANIVRQVAILNMFDELIITHVDASVKGDVSLDLNALNLDNWEIYKRDKFIKSDKNNYNFTVCRYIPVKKRFF